MLKEEKKWIIVWALKIGAMCEAFGRNDPLIFTTKEALPWRI